MLSVQSYKANELELKDPTSHGDGTRFHPMRWVYG